MNEKRTASRNPTEAAIKCRPSTSSGVICDSDGGMLNFSSGGANIETSHVYPSGTILIVRMVRYPAMPRSARSKAQSRSISLAEIKCRQELADNIANRFGMGLRYLD